MDNHDPFFGVIADRSNETDFQLGAGLEVPRAEGKFADKKIQYNQMEVSPVSCTIHGTIGAYSDLTGYLFTLDERKALWDEAVKRGADPSVGWFINSAVDLVRQTLNIEKKEQVMTFKVNVGDEDFFRALRLGYSVIAGYRGNTKFNQDKNADGILDGLDFGATTYGHCIRITYSVGDEYELIVDNIKGLNKFNVYKVKADHLKTLIRNGVFFRAGYIFVMKDAYEADNQGNTLSIPVWATVSWEKAVKKGIIKGNEDPNKPIMGADVEAMLIKTGVFTKGEGSVSFLRWVVAMDRLKLLD